MFCGINDDPPELPYLTDQSCRVGIVYKHHMVYTQKGSAGISQPASRVPHQNPRIIYKRANQLVERCPF